MKRPLESEYTSQVAYTRALEAYCDSLAQPVPDLTKRDRESYQKGHNDGVAHHKQAVKAAQPEQEPVEDVVAYHSDGTRTVRIAPKLPWVGLTYEDMVKLQKDLYDAKGESVLPTTFAMAVEAKLKEKNT